MDDRATVRGSTTLVQSLVLLVALIVAACSSAPGPSATGPAASGSVAASPAASVGGSPDPSVDSNAPASPTAAAANPVHLRILGFTAQPEHWIQTGELFTEANPTITTEFEGIPYSSYYDKAGAYIAANEGPDVMMLEIGPNLYNRTQAVLPLNEYFSQADMDLYANSQYACEGFDCTTGDIYGIPFIVQAHPIYINKNVLEEVGIDRDFVPQTWRELDETCQTVKAAGKECFALAAKEFHSLLTIALLGHATATAEDAQGLFTGDTKWTDPPILAAFQLFEDATKRGWFPENAASGAFDPDATGMFASGGSAFFQGILGGGGLDWKGTAEALGADNVGVMAFPKIEADFPIDGLTPGPFGGTLNVQPATVAVITKWSQHPVEAAAFIRFLTSEATAKRQLTEEGGFSALKQLDTSDLDLPSSYDEAQALVAGSQLPPIILFGKGDVAGVIIAQTQLILNGEATALEAAEAVQQAQEQAP